MTTQTPVLDPVPPELDALIGRAAHVIGRAAHVLNTHTNDADLCAVCGCAWPCQWAVLAEHNLAAL